ncbi:HEAT repeat domain-containing protein [Isoalcanivorax indicus]|uniref:HEAT repeat domain-containing protein n=1 Tax=Isoalcanivorax indicus TaxID=2202653 RepID=UPI000DBA20AB|nr:HEAT repeat domain-containing protein [Isoalcanivorax indicus]
MSAAAGGWGSAIGSDPALLAVLLAGAGLLSSTLLMLLATVWLHWRHGRQDARTAALRRDWTPRLFNLLTAAPGQRQAPLPSVARRDLPLLVGLCNALQDTVRGVSLDPLHDLARQLDLLPHLRRWLRSGNTDRRLDALTCLGHLRIHDAWPDVLQYLDDRDSVMSLTAARALVAIDAERGLPEILQRLNRPDWSKSRVSALLKEVPANVLARHLGARFERLDAVALRKLIRIADSLQPGQVDSLLRQACERFPEDPELRSAVCACADGPQWLGMIRAAVTDPVWIVRVQAVQALGRLGDTRDRALLATRLSDPVWWVRYRAAQALLALPGAERRDLETLAAAHDQPQVREILAHVLSEPD